MGRWQPTSRLVLLATTGGVLAAILWLGRDRADVLLQTLIRPALLALMAALLLVVAFDEPAAWPLGLVAAAALVGLWESYRGALLVLALRSTRRTTAVDQVRICTLWLVNLLSNLTLLNLAAALAFPSTFQWRDGAASALDVAYFTLLTFASGGYGDVLPATPLGKALAMLTSLSGLTYATILFAALFHRFRAD